MNVFTASEMRDVDRRAAEEYGLPSICLMEAAGIALADACGEELGGDVRGKVITVLCGKGNNGGDGFVAARHLVTRGADVRVFLVGGWTPEELTGDAATQYALLRKIHQLTDITLFPKQPHEKIKFVFPASISLTSLVVDCLFGTGFRPPFDEWARFFIETVRDLGSPVVSCDIPSGVNADTGEVGAGGAMQATRTVTLAGLKRGLLLFPGTTYAGRVTVAPIGMPPDLLDDAATATLTTADWVREKLPRRPQSRDANKGQSGTVLVIAGSAGMAGAATLCALSALRGGAGLVHLAVPESLLDTAATLAPELVLHGLPETPERTHGGAGAVEKVLALAERADAVAIGPGMSTGNGAKAFTQSFVAALSAQKMLVIDADALNLLSLLGAETLGHRNAAHTVLTPHPGEAARLLGTNAETVQNDRVAAAKNIVERYGTTVLLKGARTLIATDSPEARLYFNRRGSVVLGTAGSGDVLTGLIAALLSGRENALAAPDAARAGAFLHAVAGELWEARHGAVGALSGDLRDCLPEARESLYDMLGKGWSDV